MAVLVFLRPAPSLCTVFDVVVIPSLLEDWLLIPSPFYGYQGFGEPGDEVLDFEAAGFVRQGRCAVRDEAVVTASDEGSKFGRQQRSSGRSPTTSLWTRSVSLPIVRRQARQARSKDSVSSFGQEFVVCIFCCVRHLVLLVICTGHT